MSASEPSPAPTALPPNRPIVTDTDHRSLLNIVPWVLNCVVVIVVLTRLGTRWVKSRSISLDDVFIIVSTLFAIAQAICVSIGVAHGLGLAHIADAATVHSDTLEKMIYTFTILFLLSQYFSKLSISMFILALTPSQLYNRLTYGTMLLSTFWAVTGLFGFLFQCHVPEPWQFNGNKCFDRLAFYTFIELFSIVLDVILTIFPSYIAYRLQLQSKPKTIIIIFFMCRLFVVAASIAQLIVIYHEDREDPFSAWTFALLLVVIQSIGIITACGPYLKPFLESLNSGMIGNDDIRRRGTTVGGSHGNVELYNVSKPGSKKTTGSHGSSTDTKSHSSRLKDGAGGGLNLFRSNNSQSLMGSGTHNDLLHNTTASTGGGGGGGSSWTRTFVSSGKDASSKPRDADATSQSSESRMIRQTTSVMVRTDTNEGQNSNVY